MIGLFIQIFQVALKCKIPSLGDIRNALLVQSIYKLWNHAGEYETVDSLWLESLYWSLLKHFELQQFDVFLKLRIKVIKTDFVYFVQVFFFVTRLNHRDKLSVLEKLRKAFSSLLKLPVRTFYETWKFSL